MIHKISIYNDQKHITPTYVEIDGEKVRPYSVEYKQDVNSIPKITLGFTTIPEIKTLAEVEMKIVPLDDKTFFDVLRDKIRNDENNFISRLFEKIVDFL